MRVTLPAIALFLGIVPAVVINLNYLLAASEGYVPWCVPYWDSCTSISRTGREGTAFFFFKATMLPIALAYAWYWVLSQRTLESLGYQRKTIRYLGLGAVSAFVIYVLALGLIGDNYQLVRRIGIIFYFAFTYLCQLLIIYQLYQLRVHLWGLRTQLQLSVLVLGLGLLTVVLDLILDNYDDMEDAFEWNLALLVHGNFLLNWWGWRSYEKSNSCPG